MLTSCAPLLQQPIVVASPPLQTQGDCPPLCFVTNRPETEEYYQVQSCTKPIHIQKQAFLSSCSFYFQSFGVVSVVIPGITFLVLKIRHNAKFEQCKQYVLLNKYAAYFYFCVEPPKPTKSPSPVAQAKHQPFLTQAHCFLSCKD